MGSGASKGDLFSSLLVASLQEEGVSLKLLGWCHSPGSGPASAAAQLRDQTTSAWPNNSLQLTFLSSK